mgnify:CR=1 FL=1
MPSTKKLISDAMQLKPAEKYIVIEALVHSLDNPDPKLAELWAIEAEKRLAAYKEGKLETISFTEMFKAPVK